MIISHSRGHHMIHMHICESVLAQTSGWSGPEGDFVTAVAITWGGGGFGFHLGELKGNLERRA